MIYKNNILYNYNGYRFVYALFNLALKFEINDNFLIYKEPIHMDLVRLLHIEKKIRNKSHNLFKESKIAETITLCCTDEHKLDNYKILATKLYELIPHDNNSHISIDIVEYFNYYDININDYYPIITNSFIRLYSLVLSNTANYSYYLWKMLEFRLLCIIQSENFEDFKKNLIQEFLNIIAKYMNYISYYISYYINNYKNKKINERWFYRIIKYYTTIYLYTIFISHNEFIKNICNLNDNNPNIHFSKMLGKGASGAVYDNINESKSNLAHKSTLLAHHLMKNILEYIRTVLSNHITQKNMHNKEILNIYNLKLGRQYNYIKMDKLSGLCLYDFIISDIYTSLTLEHKFNVLKKIFLQIATSLRNIHSKMFFIHSDLHPQNIWIKYTNMENLFAIISNKMYYK